MALRLGIALALLASCSGSSSRDQNWDSGLGADFDAPASERRGAGGEGGAGGQGGAGGSGGEGGDRNEAGTGGAGGADGSGGDQQLNPSRATRAPGERRAR